MLKIKSLVGISLLGLTLVGGLSLVGATKTKAQLSTAGAQPYPLNSTIEERIIFFSNPGDRNNQNEQMGLDPYEKPLSTNGWTLFRYAIKSPTQKIRQRWGLTNLCTRSGQVKVPTQFRPSVLQVPMWAFRDPMVNYQLEALFAATSSLSKYRSINPSQTDKTWLSYSKEIVLVKVDSTASQKLLQQVCTTAEINPY